MKRGHLLYELLALFDALRGGARERQIASQQLSERKRLAKSSIVMA